MIWTLRLLLVGLMFVFLETYITSTFWNRKLFYTRCFDRKTAYEGSSIHMIEIIENRKILPVAWLRIESRISSHLSFGGQDNHEVTDGAYHSSIFCLWPYTKITRKHNVLLTKRGYYNLNNVALTGGSILGMIDSKYIDYPTNASIYVYPKPTEISDMRVIGRKWMGDVLVRRMIVEDPFFICGTREYQPGDPMNRINWKATARTNEFQVHHYDFTSDIRLMIVLNIDASREQWAAPENEEIIEKGISIAAGVADIAYRNCVETGFMSNASYINDDKLEVIIEPALHEAQLDNILMSMARLSLIRRLSFNTFLEHEVQKGKTGYDYLIVTAYMDEDLLKTIDRMRKNGNSVEILQFQ